MHGWSLIFLLTFMVTAAIPASLAFNIDVTNPELYEGEQKDFFGYKVLQFTSGKDKGILVTAPLQLNGSGGICKPDQHQTTNCFNPRETFVNGTAIPVKYFGLSIAEDSINSEFTVCSPNIEHECNDNSYQNSVCYKITDHLQQRSNFTPDFQECTKKSVDLVFLFDGSGSMTTAEFDKNKYFIQDIMHSLKNTSIKFAAVQFSSDYRKVFDFKDYIDGTALDKLTKEPHMKTLTNTHSALKYVMKGLFENTTAGASKDASKVLVLITDGDPSDTDSDGIINTYDTKNIIRFVIGVKTAQMDKFRAIASKPKDKNAFKIEEYDGLTGILENFQKRIFAIEGSSASQAGNLTSEMSQTGFSAVFHKDTLILGSVGSNTWRGSLKEINRRKEVTIEDQTMEMDSYLGYSVSVGEKKNNTLYFTGAPRFMHIGQVVLFRHDGKNWTTAQRLNGTQIGSYFGSELCSIDTNSDGETDFLLVGAPLFYHSQEKKEGQIDVYRLTNEIQLHHELTVKAPSMGTMGRFGTTISGLADLNGDGLRDVAVGAPLENDNRGAVYIFLGNKRSGIRGTFSQRIMGEKIKPGIRFFGQAIDGNIDLGEDGLPDIVVGSQGTAVVLRSRPIFHVTAHLSFQPGEISIEKIDCLSKTKENLPMITLTACFEVKETTRSKTEAVRSGLNISYMLDVDIKRQMHRGFFSQTDSKARNFTATYNLRKTHTCFNHSIYMPNCLRDTFSPICIKMNFSQEDSESASAILNVDSKRQAVVEVPFKKQCRKNDTCIAELEVNFEFSTQTLLVSEYNYFNLSIQLTNYGDDSYNTSLSVYYPLGLSFSRMTQETTRPTVHSCHGLEGRLNKTTCSISHPVYRSGSTATFNTSFLVMNDQDWDDTISITVTGASDNANVTTTNSMTKSIPVQFEIKMAITVTEETINYLNFTEEDTAPKKLVIVYKIDNLGWKDFPINVSLQFPTKLDHDFELSNYQVFVQENKTQCTEITDENSEYCTPEKRCKNIVCNSVVLDEKSAIEFRFSGDVEFRDFEQRAKNIGFLKKFTGDGAEVKFQGFIQVNYDKQQYVLDAHKQEVKGGYGGNSDPTVARTNVQVEFIIPPNQLVIITTGCILGFMLLIIITCIMIKLGCFKRKKFGSELEEDDDYQQCTPKKLTPASSKENVRPSEEKHLLGEADASGATQQADSEKEVDGNTKKDT